MTQNEYYNILRSYFIRWHKERDIWQYWQFHFDHPDSEEYVYTQDYDNTFEWTLKCCAEYKYIASPSRIPFSTVSVDDVWYGIPYGVIANARGFAIRDVFLGNEAKAFNVAREFYSDFAKHIEHITSKPKV